MGDHPPGPLCTTRVGDTWIDGGTTCRTQSGAPGITGTAEQLLDIEIRLASPAKARFDREHVYSKAPEAARKRDIDLQIIDDNYARSGEIRIDNPDYLKALIRLGSGGKKEVSSGAKKIQFFIVRGGAEGFLPSDLANKDASDVVEPGETTAGGAPSEFRFDDNDLLVVFDPKGKLIGAALLQRPTSITGAWTKETSTIIYNKWDNKGVGIYKNNNPHWSIHYLGLVVDDGMKGPGEHHGWIDMHKQEATNGCIFIVDDTAPEFDDTDPDKINKLNTFEPKLLVDILASIGKRPTDVKGKIDLGIMNLVDI